MAPGPEFGGRRQFYGTIVDHGEHAGAKYVQIDFQHAYDLPALSLARRTLRLDPQTGETVLEDEFAFDGAPLAIEEALVTWGAVKLDGSFAQVVDQNAAAAITIEEPAGAVFQAARFEEACRANRKARTLTRLTVALPDGARRFRIRIMP